MARDLDDSRPAAAIEATGAKLFRGEGTLTDVRAATVGREQLIARRAVVIATGSTAAIPPIPGLHTVEFWTNRQAAIPRELPAFRLIPDCFPVQAALSRGCALR